MNDKELTLHNLKIVAEELPKLAEKYPEIKKEFDMDQFGVFQGYTEELIKKGFCQTRGCLLGNIARLSKFSKKNVMISGVRFSMLYFQMYIFLI